MMSCFTGFKESIRLDLRNQLFISININFDSLSDLWTEQKSRCEHLNKYGSKKWASSFREIIINLKNFYKFTHTVVKKNHIDKKIDLKLTYSFENLFYCRMELIC